jgi:DNA-directed RNA polymerase specialized sigma24 family protein
VEAEEFMRVWENSRHQMRYRILKITKNPDVAEHLLQDAFVRAYVHVRQLDNDVARYLMRTATNLAFD